MVYLLDSIQRAADETSTLTFITGDTEDTITWSELVRSATAVAIVLRRHGLDLGQPVVVLGLDVRPTVTTAVGAWLAGAAVTFAPTPARTMSAPSYLRETRSRLDKLGNPLLIVGSPWQEARKELAERLPTALDITYVVDSADRISASQIEAYEPPAVSEEDPAILQMTSGTTDRAKIARVTHGNLAANVRGVNKAIGDEGVHGRTVSWLPLSHDMGLIGGLVLPMVRGDCDVVLSSPLDYLSNPFSWMKSISRYKATATVGPASAYALAAKLLATGPHLDLSSLRVALCGGEPIDPNVLEKFVAAASRHNFDPTAMLPAYGLAESTVAVSLSPLGRGLRIDSLDANLLDSKGIAVRAPAVSSSQPFVGGSQPVVNDDNIRRLTMLGSPIEGTTVRVVAVGTCEQVQDRTVGEVQIVGRSIVRSYVGDLDATEKMFSKDGWLITGDLGYIADGELVITGRLKDLIIIGGRNIYPDEVERSVCRVPEVRAGNAVAFRVRRDSELAPEGIGVAFETRSEMPQVVEAAVANQILSAIGVSPSCVIAVPLGAIPKTPSGKLQRSEAARMFMA